MDSLVRQVSIHWIAVDEFYALDQVIAHSLSNCVFRALLIFTVIFL